MRDESDQVVEAAEPDGREQRPSAAVVAVKPLTHAKSRLGDLPDPLRRRLAWCMTLDTIRALAAAVDAVWVVGSVAALRAQLAHLGDTVRVWPETRVQGINAALADGAEAARRHGAARVLACVGDLPALRPDSVRAVLGTAPGRGRSFLADASGVGTTMLLADGVELQPLFQGRSAAAHRSSGATPVELLLPDARRDVDTVVDLADAVRLGVGPSTGRLLDPATGRPGAYSVITAVGAEGGEHAAVTAAGYRVDLPQTAVAPPLQGVRPGQRLHAVLGDPPADGPRPGRRRVLSAWL